MRLLLLFALLLAGHPGFTQADSVRLNGEYLKHVAVDTRDYFLAPLRWEKRDWLRTAAFAGATALVTLADKPVNDFFSDHRSRGISSFSRYVGEPLGSEYVFLATGIFIVTGELTGNGVARSTGYLAAETLLLSSLLVRIPKMLLGRQRPDAWPPATPMDFKGAFRGESFPSGHTATAFSLASVVAYQYSSVKWVPVVSYSLASLAGLSRIYDQRHWSSDVFAGAVIGIATGHFVTRRHSTEGITITPESIDGITAVRISYNW